jgi:hypothetical protein
MPDADNALEPAHSERKPRWFRLTPERLFLMPLIAAAPLWLSERYRWFSFNELKGIAVFIALAAFGVIMLGFALWYLIALARRRRFQFGIRALVILTVTVAVLFSWLAAEINRARQEERIAASLQDRVFFGNSPSPAVPDWLTRLLGDNYFTNVKMIIAERAMSDDDLRQVCQFDEATFAALGPSAITDAGLKNIKDLARVRSLSLRNTAITDAGLQHLASLNCLIELDLNGTKTTEEGVKALRAKLPQCTIFWQQDSSLVPY